MDKIAVCGLAGKALGSACERRRKAVGEGGGRNHVRGAQTARVIRLLLLLGARRTGLTIAEMREALNVSHRTVYRDLELLAELDVPLTTDREAGRTVYQLLEHDRWKLGVPLGG